MCSLSGRCYSWSQYKSGLWRTALPDCNVAGQIGDTTNFKLLFQCSSIHSSETHVEERRAAPMETALGSFFSCIMDWTRVFVYPTLYYELPPGLSLSPSSQSSAGRCIIPFIVLDYELRSNMYICVCFFYIHKHASFCECKCAISGVFILLYTVVMGPGAFCRIRARCGCECRCRRVRQRLLIYHPWLHTLYVDYTLFDPIRIMKSPCRIIQMDCEPIMLCLCIQKLLNEV